MSEEIVQDPQLEETEEFQDDVESEETSEETEEETQEETEEGADYWKQRALEAEKTIVTNKKRAKQQVKNPVPQPQETVDNELDEGIASRISNIEVNQQKWNFATENDLDPRIVDDVYRTLGKVPTKDDLKNPVIKGAIDGAKRKYKVKDNTPGVTSNKTGFVNKDFGTLSKEEKQMEFEKYMKKFSK